MTSKRKYNWQLSRSGAADLLRRLADTLEEGLEEVSSYDISLTELSKVKIKIDLGREDVLEVKFTGKEAGSRRREDGDGVVAERIEAQASSGDYPGLKKRMQESFTAMRAALGRGEMPSREIVSAFLADSELMMSFHGAEEKAYPIYEELCVRLRAAVDAGSLDEATAAVDELGRFKKECHSKYK